MDYKEFLRQIEVQIKERMGKEVHVFIHSVTKNNSITMDGLSILQRGENISPAIYLNGFYQDYLTGETMESIVNRILYYYGKGKQVGNIDVSFYTDTEKVKERIVCRVVNLEKNQQLLQEIPYRSFLNLAIVYSCLLEMEAFGTASILVRKEHLKMWDIDEAELDRIAGENMKRLQPYRFFKMSELFREMTESSDLFPENIPLYVLTNAEKGYGAVWMAEPSVLKEIGERLGQDYYVLPSSVHECVIVPEENGAEERELAQMVREINLTQVEPEEVLANTIYHYNRNLGKLQIVPV